MTNYKGSADFFFCFFCVLPSLFFNSSELVIIILRFFGSLGKRLLEQQCQQRLGVVVDRVVESYSSHLLKEFRGFVYQWGYFLHQNHHLLNLLNQVVPEPLVEWK